MSETAGRGRRSNPYRGTRHEGRGSGRGGGRYTNTSRKKVADKEYKFHPHGSGKNTASFSQTLNEVILSIQKSWDGGKDIADTLEARQKIDMKNERPEREESQEVDAKKKEFEQESLDMVFKEDYKRFLGRLDLYERNLPRAFALIMKNYCTPQMVIRLKEIGDYETRVKNEVLILLTEIEKIMNQPKRSSYPFLSLADTLAGMINFKQNELSVVEYKEEFKQKRALVASLMGTKWLDKFVENSEEYTSATATKQKEMKDEAFEQFTALLFMRGANNDFKETYNGFGLRYSKDKSTDEYPKTMQQAVDVMAAVRPKKKVANKDPGRDNQMKNQDGRSDGQERVHTSFAQRGYKAERRCFRCGDTQHVSPDCPHKNKVPSGQWFRETGIEHFHSFLNTNDEDVSVGSEVSSRSNQSTNQRVSWSGANICMQQNAEDAMMPSYKDLLILDTGSTHNMSCNESFVYDIENKPGGWHLNANTGSKRIEKKSKFPGIEEAAMHSTSFLTNILSFGRLRRLGWKIEYKYEEDMFVVSDPEESFIVKFHSNEDGLYAAKPGPKYMKFIEMKNKQKLREYETSFVQTLNEQLKNFSAGEIERARKARKLYHAISAPDLTVMKKHFNQLCDNEIPWDDVVLAEKIFGWDVSTAKGRWIKKRPNRVKYEEVDIPRELIVQNSRVELCIDLMFINNCVFLTAIDKTIPFRSCASLPSKASRHWATALRLLMRKYNQAGFFIKLIRADNEFKETLEDVVERVPDMPDVNHCGSDEHVPEAERNNRMIQERFRIQYNRWPFKVVPRIMIRHLARRVCHDINIFPNKKGISKIFSPYTIMNRRNFSVKTECQHEPGEFVIGFQDNKENTNTPMPRGVECIYLNPTKDLQEGHELMNLQTGELINRPVIKAAPMPNWAIKRVEELATSQGMKTLKFFNRKKEEVSFSDPDHETGVDDDDEKEEDGNNEEEEEKDDDNSQEEIEVLNDPDPNLLLVEKEDSNRSESDLEDAEDEKFMEEENSDSEDDDKSEEFVAEKNSDSEDDDKSNPVVPRRSGRETKTVNDPLRNIESTKGKSYTNISFKSREPAKKVHFFDEDSTRMKEMKYNFFTQGLINDMYHEYSGTSAGVIGSFISNIKSNIRREGISFIQQFSMRKGLKTFGKETSMKSMTKEIQQLHQRNSFKPIDVSNMTDGEKARVQDAIMLLTQKESEDEVKSRLVYNGKETRKWLSREETASPTVSLESINLTFAIDAHEERDVMIADVPNAFVQTCMPSELLEEDKRIIMKIKGVLVDILYALDPVEYEQYIVFENNEKVLYLVLTKVLYGMLVAALLWYRKFRKDLESIGFRFSEYDPCVGFRKRVGSQHTIRFHVDDVASSHKNRKVNDKFFEWLNKKYGSIKAVKATRGDKHKYLGMTVNFEKRGCVRFEQFDKVEDLIENGPVRLKRSDTAMTPSSNNLMSRDDDAKLIDSKERKEQYHNVVAKAIFLSKRSRPDIQPTVAVLATRVREPSESDWSEMVRLLKYLNGTRNKCLTLRVDNLNILKWYVDVSFGVHPDFRSHTGGVLTMGHGAIISMSRKQKLNTRNTCEAELVGADDMSVLILWTKLFLEELGYTVDRNILKQDNKAAILLETNGRKSVGKRNRAINVRYFFLTDQIARGNVEVEYCCTDEMIGDFMTKPLQGSKFRSFRKAILGED